jgi:cytochrome b subunit of formate dehydrogenase
VTTVTVVKLSLTGVALLLFIAGARMDIPTLRWAAIALMLAAVALRFYKPRV